MTAKKKAKELVEKFVNADFNCTDCNMPYCDVGCTTLSISEAKQCALMCVDETQKELKKVRSILMLGGKASIDLQISYYETVKQEIEKL